ncbi:MAG: CDGSH iron-sulfur domain-containing protein [Myxococcota bacterium]
MSDTPTIQAAENGPLLVKGLTKLTDADGNEIPMKKDVIALCRCGASANKPFCDGAHSKIGFTGKKERTETYEVRRFDGKEIGVSDDVGICCHAGECVRGAREVFFTWEDGVRISTPDAASAEKVAEVIGRCPSGSLLAVLNGEVQAKFFEGQTPEIRVAKDGPLEIRGEMTLTDPGGAQPVTDDHYTLCRCGASKNKPFCDGAHSKVGFEG